MAEERHEPTPAQVKRPALPRDDPARPAAREDVIANPMTKHCEVLKESCENPADWIAKTVEGSEIPVCDEHKELVAINYPGVEFTYEEV